MRANFEGTFVMSWLNTLLSPIFGDLDETSLFQTLKHSFNYLLGSTLTKAIGLISIPIFTRLLTTTDYGILAVVNSYVGMCGILFSLNSHTSVGRYYFEGDGKLGEF